MGLKKAYDELTDNPEFSDGISVSAGESIYDSNDNSRIEFNSSYTNFSDEEGVVGISLDNGSGFYRFIPRSGIPFQILDGEGSYPAVQYTTSAPAPGTLELTNANLDMAGQDISNANSVSTESLELEPLDQKTFTISGGETQFGTISGASLGDSILATAFPVVGQSNDVGATTPEIWYLEDNDLMRWRTTETENSGGGEIRVEFYLL